MVWGVSHKYFELSKIYVEQGRYFTDDEDKSRSKVVVIGSELKEKLFGRSDAVEKTIKIGKHNFRVIGIMEEQGGSAFFDMDNSAFMPVRTLQDRIMGVDHVQFIFAYLKDTNLAEATASDITYIMRDQHDIADPKKDDFAVTTMEEAMGMLDAITGGITLLLMAVAGVSLLVGGVGIMNIMYVSVSERTYEIGLRKAVGATNKNILWQFLWEALFLTFCGGIIGVTLGEIISVITAQIASNFGFGWGAHFSLFGLILGVGFSLLIGLIFGIYPARQAAKLEPVDALRKK